MDDDSNSASNRGFRNVSLGLPEWESERREALMSDDDFSIVDAMSASSSSALDNVTRVLDRAAARGRLAEAVEPNPLFVNLAVDFCLAKLTETGGEAAVAADPSGGTSGGTSPLAAAAGLRQLVSHGRLGLLVGRSTLAEVLVQVVEMLQDPELLAAALDVMQCLLSTEALGSRRHAPTVAAVMDRCLGLCRRAACVLDAAFTATAGSGSSSSAESQQQPQPQRKQSPSKAEAPLALAAVGFLKGPLAALSQLPPEQRAQLAADVTALLRAQVGMGAAAVDGRGCSSRSSSSSRGGSDSAASAAAGVADCLELLRALLQQDAAAVAATVASSAGGAATSAAACSAAFGAGCLPAMCAVLRASSSQANPQEQAAAGDVGGAVVGGMQLTPVQDLVLWCLINIANISSSVTTSCSAQPAQKGSPRVQMLSAGGTALLVPLLRAPAAAKRVLQLLMWLAAADGPEAQRHVAAALVEACARCPEMQRQLVGAAGSCVTELQQQRPMPVASSQQLQLLLESVAAVVQGQRSVATGLLLPDWGGLPLVRAALRCLGVGSAGALPDDSSSACTNSASSRSAAPPFEAVTAALRLLRQLLLRCGPPPHSSLPTTYEELVRALVRLNGLDDVDNSLRMSCLHACLVRGSGSSPSGRLPLRREAARSLHAALGDGDLPEQLAALLAVAMERHKQAEEAGAAGSSSSSSSSSSSERISTSRAASSDSHATQLELLQLTACVLDAAWLVAAAEVASSSAGSAAAGANVGATAAGSQAPRPAAVRTPAAFVMRLAVAAVPCAARYVRDLLADPDPAEPPAASDPLQLEIWLRSLHAAVAALLATPGGAAVMRETDGCVAGDLVGDLVPLLLGVRARAATAAPVPAGSSSSSSSTIASLALQILVMLSTTSDSGDVAFLAEAIMCSQVQQQVEEHGPPLPAVWSRLMAAAVPVVRGALPPDVCAVLLAPVAAEAAGGEAGGEAGDVACGEAGGGEAHSAAASDLDVLACWREAARVPDEDFIFAVQQLGLALLSGASTASQQHQQQQEHQQQQQDSVQLGTDHAACVTLFALGFVEQATSSVSARMTTGTEGWLLAAAARLLRPLAPQLPREQLAMLVRALTLRVAGGSGMYGSLAAECRLPVLLCLAACVENPLLREKDWPELACRGYGAVCDHLVEEVTSLQDSSLVRGGKAQQRQQPQQQEQQEQQRADHLLLLRLACRCCLRAASQPTLKQQLQQLASAMLQAALQSAAASQPLSAPACPPAAAPAAALDCLAECLLAVCEGPLPALYGTPPPPLLGLQQAGGASSGAAAAAGAVEAADRMMELAMQVQRATAVLAEHLPIEDLGSSGSSGGVSSGGGSSGGTRAAAVQQPFPTVQLLLLRAVVCGGRWAAHLSALQQEVHEAKAGARLQRDVEQMEEQRRELASLRTEVQRLHDRNRLHIDESKGLSCEVQQLRNQLKDVGDRAVAAEARRRQMARRDALRRQFHIA